MLNIFSLRVLAVYFSVVIWLLGHKLLCPVLRPSNNLPYWWLAVDCRCCDFPVSLVVLPHYRILDDLLCLPPIRPHLVTLSRAGKLELALPVLRQGVVPPLYRIGCIRILCLNLPGVAWWVMELVPRVHDGARNLNSLSAMR